MYMVFDVESIGLHGEGFAVGYVVVHAETWNELDHGLLACLPSSARGEDDDRQWVAENVPPIAPNCADQTRVVRGVFWKEWLLWRDQGAWLAADVAWPVEARFLAQCVDDEPSRSWEGPYPLIDIASVRFAAGLDPLATELRLANETPPHNPLADARQSARLFWEALQTTPRAQVSYEVMHE